MRRPPRIVIGVALLAGLAGWVAIDMHSAPSGKAPAAGGSQRFAESATSLSRNAEPAIPERSTLAKITSNPFDSVQAWLAPRGAASKGPTSSAPPPPPVAPPLPYRFVGQFHGDSGFDIYLGRGEEIFPARAGDTLEGQYKIESLSTTEVAFMHLASNTRQTLQFGPPLKEADPSTQIGAIPARPAAAGGVGAAEARMAGSPVAHRQGGQAQLRWDGPTSTRAGASFSLTLRATSIEHIRSAPMQVRFDPSVLESVSVRPGRYFGAAGGKFGYRVNRDGSIFVGVSNDAPVLPAADAELVVLTFKSIRPGTAAEVSVASVNLQGSAGHVIAYGEMTPFKAAIIP